MTPYLITPPATPPVTVSQVKADPMLRVEHSEEDAALQLLIEAFTADLDGWNGTLGRCIMPQTWAVDVLGPGPHLLPFPDASDVVAERDGDPVAAEVCRTGLGQVVTVAEALATEALQIRATYGLSAADRSRAKVMIILMIKRHYDQAQGPEYNAYSDTIAAMIGSLRWRRA